MPRPEWSASRTATSHAQTLVLPITPRSECLRASAAYKRSSRAMAKKAQVYSTRDFVLETDPRNFNPTASVTLTTVTSIRNAPS